MQTGTANADGGAEAGSAADLAGELAAWAAGGGIVMAILFPLAMPIVALTAVAALPLVPLALVGGLAAALLALPVIAIRALLRRVGASRRFASVGAPRPAPVHRDPFARRGYEPSPRRLSC